VTGMERDKAPVEWSQSEGGNPMVAMETDAIARPFV